MPEPEIGIVVPTLNSAATLDWTLCSLQNQRGIRPQIIVVDSGSADGTAEICRKWGVSTRYATPGNMYRAINKGIRELDARWVTYLNSDDTVYPNSYVRLVRYGERERAAVVYGDCDFTDEEGRTLYTFRSASPNWLSTLFQNGIMGLAQPATIFRNDTFRSVGGFDETFRFVSDFDFFYRLAVRQEKYFKVEGTSMAAFRVHPSQLTIRAQSLMAEELRACRSRMATQKSFKNPFIVSRWRFRNAPRYISRIRGYLSRRDGIQDFREPDAASLITNVAAGGSLKR